MALERPFTWRIRLRWLGTTTFTMALLGMVSAVSTARFSPNAYTLTISACFLVAIFLPHLLILRPWFRDSYSREIRDYGIVDTFGGSWLGGLTSLVLLGLFLPNYRFVERIAFGIDRHPCG